MDDDSVAVRFRVPPKTFTAAQHLSGGLSITLPDNTSLSLNLWSSMNIIIKKI